MIVILEGPDGAGKTTLATYLAGQLNFRLQLGEGVPRNEQALHERIDRYSKLSGPIVFDRYPTISQVIYQTLKGGDIYPTTTEIDALLAYKPFFIYCRATDMTRHTLAPHDTAEHVDHVRQNFGRLVAMYDRWALDHARVIYRIGDSKSAIVDMIRACYREE